MSEAAERRATTEPTLAERVARLEKMAYEGEGLSRAVNRLGLNASALGEALMQVERNQRTLQELTADLDATKRTVVPRSEHESTAATLRQERRSGIRHALLSAAVFIPLAAYVAINVHEVYRDNCDSTLEGPAAWCDDVFFFDHDGDDGNPLQVAVNRAVEAGRQACESGNDRARTEAGVLRDLAVTSPTDPARLLRAAERLERTVLDCAAAYPEVRVPAGGH